MFDKWNGRALRGHATRLAALPAPAVQRHIASAAWLVFLFAVGIVPLAGCASQGQLSVQGPTENGESVVTGAVPESGHAYQTDIAAMLVGTLSQLSGFEPLAVTVQVTPAVTDFGSAIVQQFRKSGYGMQRVSEDHGRNYVSYARTEIISDAGFIVEYSLTLRDVVIMRKFRETSTAVQPVSPIIVAGAEPQRVHPASDAFRPATRDNAYPGGVVFELADGKRISFERDDSISLKSVTRTGSVSSLLELNSAETIDINDYVSVREAVVEFPTADSKMLGEPNKRLIRSFVSGFSPGHDLITLSGCSLDAGATSPGPSQPAQSLAWQNRVRYELMSAGVNKKRIRISACAEGEARDNAPRRTVVLTLRRLKAASS